MELVRDFDIVLFKDNRQVRIVRVRDNHLRFCPCRFEKTPCDSFEIRIRATNGADTVCIFEIRAYWNKKPPALNTGGIFYCFLSPLSAAESFIGFP